MVPLSINSIADKGDLNKNDQQTWSNVEQTSLFGK